MKKLFCLSSGLLVCVMSLCAQNAPLVQPCGHKAVLDKIRHDDPGYEQRWQDYLQNVQAPNAAAKTTGMVYRVPVVFHVIYNTSQGNLPDSILQNQIQVLNAAYRKRHADTSLTRVMFKPRSIDAEIEFVLANRDPQWNSTTGITRTVTAITRFGDLYDTSNSGFGKLERIKHTAQGGKDGWPSSRYLNIWVVDMADSTLGLPYLLGYATPPANPLPPNWSGADFSGLGDGVVLQYQAVGSNNPYSAQVYGIYTKGRCAVHEIGHYLGLRHIWGDADGTPQACTPAGDDGVADTPPQSTNSQGGNPAVSPASTKNSCGAGATGDEPDMWENYMDYAADRWQNLFTAGQVNLMRSVLAMQRDTLTLATGDIISSPEMPQLIAYPSPASSTLNVEFSGRFSALQLLDITGRTVKAWGVPADRNAGAISADISDVAPGLYFLRARGAAIEAAVRVIVRR